MRIVLQRAKNAKVTVDGKVLGEIDQGLVVLVGFQEQDTKEIVEKMVLKMIGLRIFSDENDKMNLSLKDVNGKVLSISQFTLYANCKKGRRPSFIEAAKPEHAVKLYEYFNQYIRENDIKVEKGEFGADMKVQLINDGPVTIVLDSDEIC